MFSLKSVVLSFAMWSVAAAAFAHGPQLQITNDNDKITTRRLFLDSPLTPVTPPKSVYVMPMMELGGVWYSQPNRQIHPITLAPAFLSGPGLAYGSDLADGGPQAFETGSVLSVGFTDGLKQWNGAAFVDPGVTEIKAFRGTNVNIASPPENIAFTSDIGPFDSVSISPVAVNYGSEGAGVHNTIRFALLGDGVSPTSSSSDGIYLLSLRVSSTQEGLAPSDEYFFVFHKNATRPGIEAAIHSLGFPDSRVQWVPEPGSLPCLVMGVACVFLSRTLRKTVAR